MIVCSYCGKDLSEHGPLSLKCLRYINGSKTGYQDGKEFKTLKTLVERNKDTEEVGL